MKKTERKKSKAGVMLIAVAISFLLVSTVTAVPNVKVDDRQMAVSNIFENFNFGLFNRLKNRVIDEFGMDVYNDTYARVKFIFYDHIILDVGQGFYLTEDGTDYEFREDMLGLGIYDVLIDIAVTLILISVIALGHNALGYGLGSLVSAVVLLTPCFLFAMVTGVLCTFDTVTLLLLNGNSFEDIFYEYGVLGLLIVMCLYLPLITLISIVVYPIYVIGLTAELLFALIAEALEIVEDMSPSV